MQEARKRWSDRGGGKTCRIDDNPKTGDDAVSAQRFSLKPMLQLGKRLFRFQCCEWHRDRMIWKVFGIRGIPRCKWWLFRSSSSLRNFRLPNEMGKWQVTFISIHLCYIEFYFTMLEVFLEISILFWNIFFINFELKIFSRNYKG